MDLPRADQVEPRALPRRRDGKDIFIAVLDATERLIETRGIAALTTNHIAETAGVGIGSFYRYFGNKETAVAEVQRRRERRTIERVMSQLSEMTDASLEEKIRVTVGALVGPAQGGLTLRRELLDIPRCWIDPTATEAEDELRRFLCQQIASFFTSEDAELIAFICMYAVERVIEAAVLRQPALLDDPRFVDHLTRLILGYVEGSAVDAIGSRGASG